MNPPVKTRTATAALLLPLALTACGSGKDPLTYQGRDQGDSAQAVADQVAVLNLRVLPPREGDVLPAGGDARVALSLVNEDAEDDALLSVTSPAAASVAIVKDTAPVASVPLPARRTAEEGYSLVLRGLTADLRPGTYVTLRLVFQNAPALELRVPVSTPLEVRPRASANTRVNEPAHGGGGESHEEVENVVEKAGAGQGEGGAAAEGGH